MKKTILILLSIFLLLSMNQKKEERQKESIETRAIFISYIELSKYIKGT